MTYASTRVETYILTARLMHVVRQVERLHRLKPALPSVVLGASVYRQLDDLVRRQSLGRMTLDGCTISGLPIQRCTS